MLAACQIMSPLRNENPISILMFIYTGFSISRMTKTFAKTCLASVCVCLDTISRYVVVNLNIACTMLNLLDYKF